MTKRLFPLLSIAMAICMVQTAMGVFDIRINSSDFAITPVFSDLQNFDFLIRIDEPLEKRAYNDPSLRRIAYNVFAFLDDTPSGFDQFGLQRTIVGNQFYNQGSSLSFEIDAAADFTDGLQVSDLSSLEFRFDGREVNTGRYHPPLFVFDRSGTGRIQNSNNFGGVNPASGQVVDLDYGDEYIADLSFDPSLVTLVETPDGDFNGDGLWDCQDINSLSVMIAGGSNASTFDMNLDGQVNDDDMFGPQGWLAVGGANNSAVTAGNPFLPGDINLDGVVDVSDFQDWNNNKFTFSTAWCSGDLNLDGVTDVSDFAIWNNHKFLASDQVTAVPEPGGLAMMLLALLGVIRYASSRASAL